MKQFLNFGVSDPLTLGMAHPIADRLDILSRGKTVSKGGRATVLGLIGGLVVITAPLTIAADQPDADHAMKMKVVSSLNGENIQSYEIVTENGERKAYKILKGGEREPATLDQKDDGSYRLTYSNGETVDVPNLDFEKLEDLKSLKGLDALAGLDALEGLEELGSLSKLSSLMIEDGVFSVDGAPEHISIMIDGPTIEIDIDDPNLSEEDRREMKKILSGELKEFTTEMKTFEWVEGDDVRTIVLDEKDGTLLSETILSAPFGDFFGDSPEFYEDVDAEIEALMADDSIDIRTRKAKARKMKAGALQSAFRRANPMATRDQKIQNCLSILDVLDRDYRYHNQSNRDESHQSKCESMSH